MFTFSIEFMYQEEKKWCNNCHKQVETNIIKRMGTTQLKYIDPYVESDLGKLFLSLLTEVD